MGTMSTADITEAARELVTRHERPAPLPRTNWREDAYVLLCAVAAIPAPSPDDETDTLDDMRKRVEELEGTIAHLATLAENKIGILRDGKDDVEYLLFTIDNVAKADVRHHAELDEQDREIKLLKQLRVTAANQHAAHQSEIAGHLNTIECLKAAVKVQADEAKLTAAVSDAVKETLYEVIRRATKA